MEKSILLISLLLSFQNSVGQEKLEIIFWNVENLFHPSDDSLTADDEFTPAGLRHWSFLRYNKKLNSTWKTIFLAGEGDPPAIVAICEIENREVLDRIFSNSPLKNYSYSVIHRDSPDPRGIDVGLAYRSDLVTLLDTRFIKPQFDELNGRPTRDILHAEFIFNRDTFQIFVNHWPSKYGGAGYTDILRVRTAEILRKATLPYLLGVRSGSVICCGDFNDVTGSGAINLLCQKEDSSGNPGLEKVSLASNKASGTLKYQGKWEQIDHFFVFFQKNSGQPAGPEIIEGRIVEMDILLEKDDKYGGLKPRRTYEGFRYHGGISDHLPIILRIKTNR